MNDNSDKNTAKPIPGIPFELECCLVIYKLHDVGSGVKRLSSIMFWIGFLKYVFPVEIYIPRFGDNIENNPALFGSRLEKLVNAPFNDSMYLIAKWLAKHLNETRLKNELLIALNRWNVKPYLPIPFSACYKHYCISMNICE